MFVKPAVGLVIRDPDLLDLLPASGRQVLDSGYWQRRLRDGDVVEAPPAATAVDTEPAPAELPEQPVEVPPHNDFDNGAA